RGELAGRGRLVVLRGGRARQGGADVRGAQGGPAGQGQRAEQQDNGYASAHGASPSRSKAKDRAQDADVRLVTGTVNGHRPRTAEVSPEIPSCSAGPGGA